jgi:hypothetical protein
MKTAHNMKTALSSNTTTSNGGDSIACRDLSFDDAGRGATAAVTGSSVEAAEAAAAEDAEGLTLTVGAGLPLDWNAKWIGDSRSRRHR